MVGAATVSTNNATTAHAKAMIKYPQHIKKQCTVDSFRLLESGRRSFEIKVSDLEVEDGDYITFLEMDETGTQTGRSLTKKVTLVEPLDVETLAKAHHPPEVISLEEADVRSLKTLFDDHYIMAFVLDKREADWQIVEGPIYLPVLICPDLLNSGILRELKIDNWPVGVYCVHLKVTPKVVSQTDPVILEREDTLILVMVPHTEDGVLVGIEVDWTALVYGKCITPHGQAIEAAHPEAVIEAFTPQDLDSQLDDVEYEERIYSDLQEGLDSNESK